MSQLIESLRKSMVLFYPGCGFDTGPLDYLRDICDTFVFCDWAISEPTPGTGNCAGALSEDELSVPGTLGENDLAFLTAEEQRSYRNRISEIKPRNWATLGEFAGNGSAPPARLIRIGAEAAATYWDLFNANEIRPVVLAIIRTDGFAGNWTEFGDWSAPLARIARANPAGLPKFLLTSSKPNREWNQKLTEPRPVLEQLNRDSPQEFRSAESRPALEQLKPASLQEFRPDEFQDILDAPVMNDEDAFGPAGGYWPYFNVVREISYQDGRGETKLFLMSQ